MKYKFLLRFYGRDELEQMKISESQYVLELFAQEEIGARLSFKRAAGYITFLYCNDVEIGVIGPIEELKG